jgi:hypothetical protein
MIKIYPQLYLQVRSSLNLSTTRFEKVTNFVLISIKYPSI